MRVRICRKTLSRVKLCYSGLLNRSGDFDLCCHLNTVGHWRVKFAVFSVQSLACMVWNLRFILVTCHKLLEVKVKSRTILRLLI
jgi:hypothetical protein